MSVIQAAVQPARNEAHATDALPRHLTRDHLAARCRERGLAFPDRVTGTITAALRAGKHVVLTGAPGTGKTSLAATVAELAADALLCRGHLLATATNEWTVRDTIGEGVHSDAGVGFRPGVVVEAIETGRWLVIDELNRANIDGAFGELFTVLAGQAVVLPHRRNEFADRLAIVPPGVDVPPDSEPIMVPKSWRMIASMNTSDRGLLFKLSRALMRRFAFVHLHCPNDNVYRDLLRGPGDFVADLLPIRDLQEIGPAPFLDARDYAAARVREGVTRSAVLFEAFAAYLVPQLEPTDDVGAQRLLGILDDLFDSPERDATRALLYELNIVPR